MDHVSPHPTYKNNYVAPMPGLEVTPAGLEVVPGAGPEVFHRSPTEATREGRKLQNKKWICGLERRTLFILIVLAMFALALLGALAGTLSRNHRKDTTASPSPITSSTTSTPRSSPTPSNDVSTSQDSARSSSILPKETLVAAGIVATRSCPAFGDRNYTVPGTDNNPGQDFKIYCSWIFNYLPTNDSGAFTTQASSLEECIDRCAAFNTLYEKGSSGPCVNVAWRWGPRDDKFGYCWGHYPPAIGHDSAGRNITTGDAPLDSAILWAYVPA